MYTFTQSSDCLKTILFLDDDDDEWMWRSCRIRKTQEMLFVSQFENCHPIYCSNWGSGYLKPEFFRPVLYLYLTQPFNVKSELKLQLSETVFSGKYLTKEIWKSGYNDELHDLHRSLAIGGIMTSRSLL